MKKNIKKAVMMLFIIAVSGIHAYGQWDQAIYDTSVDSAEYKNVGEICEGTVIEQEFTSEYNGMNGLSIRMGTWERKNQSKLEYSLVDGESGQPVAEGTVSLKNVVNNDYNAVTFPEIEESKGKKYILRIKDENIKEGEGITIFSTQKARNGGGLRINGEASDEALVVKAAAKEFNVEDFIVLIGLLLYIAGFVKLLYKFLK